MIIRIILHEKPPTYYPKHGQSFHTQRSSFRMHASQTPPTDVHISARRPTTATNTHCKNLIMHQSTEHAIGVYHSIPGVLRSSFLLSTDSRHSHPILGLHGQHRSGCCEHLLPKMLHTLQPSGSLFVTLWQPSGSLVINM